MLIALTNNIALAQPISGSVDLPDTTIELDFGAEKDAVISNRIRAALAALDGYEAVEVEVDAGVVSLSGSAVDEAAVLRLEQIVRRIDGVVAVNDRVAASTDLAERLAPIRGRFVNRLWQTVSYLPLLTVAVVVFILVYLLGAAIGRITSVWRSLAPNAFIASIYAQLVRLVFAILGIVAALDILGATALLGSILGAAGIIGLAIGFAVRDTVENFIASVMLSIRQPFSPFDTIGIDGDVGKVVRLTSRATILISPEGNLVRVPNATVFKSRLVNFSRNPERRFSFSLDVDPSAELAGLREALQAKLAALPFVLPSLPRLSGWRKTRVIGSGLASPVGLICVRQTGTCRAARRSGSCAQKSLRGKLPCRLHSAASLPSIMGEMRRLHSIWQPRPISTRPRCRSFRTGRIGTSNVSWRPNGRCRKPTTSLPPRHRRNEKQKRVRGQVLALQIKASRDCRERQEGAEYHQMNAALQGGGSAVGQRECGHEQAQHQQNNVLGIEAENQVLSQCQGN